MIINKHINLLPSNIKLMSWSFLLSLDDIFGSSSNQQTRTRGHSTTSVSFDQVRKQIVVMITIFVLICWPELKHVHVGMSQGHLTVQIEKFLSTVKSSHTFHVLEISESYWSFCSEDCFSILDFTSNLLPAQNQGGASYLLGITLIQ